MAWSVISLNWCLIVSCERISHPAVQLTRRRITAGTSQLAVEALAVLTSWKTSPGVANTFRSEEHTSELQSLRHLVCRLLLVKQHLPMGSWAASRASRQWRVNGAVATGP